MYMLSSVERKLPMSLIVLGKFSVQIDLAMYASSNPCTQKMYPTLPSGSRQPYALQQ